MYVDLRWVKPALIAPRDCTGGRRLVDLGEVDIVSCPSDHVQKFARGGDEGSVAPHSPVSDEAHATTRARG
ncbi:MAG: hypothetical protein MUQ00_16975 [Candidatus Aminicenantes bacterium]|nr:hypothetical protein [Candidatus Aminicenantes bacterium]